MADQIDTRDDEWFHEELTGLIERAYHDGVTVEGARKCTIDGNGDFHWDVQISRVKYGDD